MTEYKMTRNELTQDKNDKAVENLIEFLTSWEEYKKTDIPLCEIFARNFDLVKDETEWRKDDEYALTYHKLTFNATDFGRRYPDLFKKFNQLMKKVNHFTTTDKILPTFTVYNFFTYY